MKTYKDLTLEGLTDGLSSGRLGGRVSLKEDLARDIEAGFKKLSSKKARSGKSDGFEGKSIKCGDFSITPVKYHDASDTTPGADENIAFHVYVEDGKGKAVTDKIGPSQGNDAIDFMEYGKFDSSDKKTAKEIEKWCNSNRTFDPKEEVEPVDELSAQTAQNAEIKARMAGPDKRKQRQVGKFQQYGQSKAQGGRGIDVRNKTMNQTGPVKTKGYFETEQIDEAVKNKKIQKAIDIMKGVESIQDWVEGWADETPEKYEYSMGKGSVYPTENIIKFAADREKVCKKWTKDGSSWDPIKGSTGSRHIKE